ncbi:MAG TPA: folylpolyglutamate synthase/dihydrofolate synthase family protein [Armatimonadota bacterium]|jgi:dihydrofolate synthase/folylpolyglutamate synthase
MTFPESEQYLFGLIDYEKTPAQQATGAYLHLDRMREAMTRLQNPQARLRCVHIAGTKGKGSTAAMVAQMLRAAGRRVGLFTSPHLITFRERMRIDDQLISEDELARLVGEIRPVIEAMRDSVNGAPTFFEAYTLLAFRWFAEQHVDFVVLETGMGGRLDATNVVTPLVTAITTIAYDHMTELGHTLAAIAEEKAGIIKQGIPVVSAPQQPEAAEVIARVAAEHESALYRVGAEITILPSTFVSPVSQRFTIEGRRGVYADISCPLLGEHQQVNAAVAIGIVECLRDLGESIPPTAVRTGMATVHWPGRMQVLRERPLLLLDGAHDPASVTALLAALDRHFPGRPRHFVLGFSREKDWPQMLRQFAPAATRMVLTAAATPRAVPPGELAEAVERLNVPAETALTVSEAVALALRATAPNDLLCVTGSLYVVGDALKWWQAH